MRSFLAASRSQRAALVAIIALAVIVRIGWGLTRTADRAAIARELPDQREYVELADNLLAGRGLQFYDERFGADVKAYRTPGYPLFIALCGGNLRVVRIAQAALDASCALAIYLLARRWLSPRGALVAAALVALNPFLIYFSGLLLSETLFTALLVWGMALLVRGTRESANNGLNSEARGGGEGASDSRAASAVRESLAPSPPRSDDPRIVRSRRHREWTSFLLGAFFLALSESARPSALLLPAFLVALAARMNGRPILLRLTVSLGLAVALTIPWAYRNLGAVGAPVFTTTNGGITLYDGFNPGATGASDQRFVRSMPELRRMSEVERSNYLTRLASDYVRDHPGRSLWLAAVKIARTWSPIPLSSEYGGNAIYVIVAAGYSAPLFALAAIGLIRWRAPWPAKAFLLLPAIYFTLVHAASVGSLRYRIPAEVSMTILAAGGVASYRSRRQRVVASS